MEARSGGASNEEKNIINFYTRPYTVPQYSFLDCKRQLMVDFRHIYAQDITNVLQFHGGQYAKAHRSLSLAMEKLDNKLTELLDNTRASKDYSVNITITNDDGECATFRIQPLAKMRLYPRKLYGPPSLRPEIAFVKERLHSEKEDRQLAMRLMDEDCESPCQSIECECCFATCTFENMAQCIEGHLVCVDCLIAYSRELVFGSGKVDLRCLAPECTESYPRSELRRCLPSSVWNKLEEREMIESLNSAGVEDLVRCPYCQFAAVLSPLVKTFHCHNEACKKVTCRQCGTDWNGHEGLPCSEVEKRDETFLRKDYEEKMTTIKVRTCVACKASFMKEDGCNKMTCRCGVTMCYLCRTPKITYAHFCGHPRSPGRPCEVCTACSLWTNPEEDEERAITNIKTEAQEKRKIMGFDVERVVGAPTDAKKAKHSSNADLQNAVAQVGVHPQPPQNAGAL